MMALWLIMQADCIIWTCSPDALEKRCRHFELVEADERTLRRMEADCNNYPLSNAAAVTARLQAALAAVPAGNQLRTQLQLLDTEGTGRVSISDLQVSLPVDGCVSGQRRPFPSMAAHVAPWSGWDGSCSQRGVLTTMKLRPHVDMQGVGRPCTCLQCRTASGAKTFDWI